MKLEYWWWHWLWLPLWWVLAWPYGIVNRKGGGGECLGVDSGYYWGNIVGSLGASDLIYCRRKDEEVRE